MKRFIIAAVAAVVLASTPAAAQTTVGLEALADVTGRAYSIGGWAKVRMVVLSVDLGCLKHQMEENGADATHRDRLQVVGLGAQFGPVVVSGHVGQAVRSQRTTCTAGASGCRPFPAPYALPAQGQVRRGTVCRTPFGRAGTASGLDACGPRVRL